MRDRFSPVAFLTFLALQTILFGGFRDAEAKPMEVSQNQVVAGQEFCAPYTNFRLTPNNTNNSNIIRLLENQLVRMTGEPSVEFDGYTWFRVQLPGTEDSGYVAFETLRPVSSCPTTTDVVPQVNHIGTPTGGVIDIYISEVRSIFDAARNGSFLSIPHDQHHAHNVLFVLPRTQGNVYMTNFTQQFIIFSPNIPVFTDVASVTYRNQVRLHLPSPNPTGYTVCSTVEPGQNGQRLPSAIYVDDFLAQAASIFGSNPIFVSSMNGRFEDPASGTFAVSLICEP